MFLKKLSLILLISSLAFNFFELKANLNSKDSIFTFSGTVIDSEIGRSQFRVTVKAADLDKGTFTDKEGRFSLKLPKGKHTIIFSMVGHKALIKEINLITNIEDFNVVLEVNAALSGDVVVIAETVAERLMRKTIEKKKRIADSAKTYTYMLYTKLVVSADTSFAGRKDNNTDTTIMSIFESYSKGYYKKPDSYYNEIIQRRQSVNIPAQANLVTFGTSISAFEDFVTLVGQEVATPFHTSALEYYEFILDENYENPASRAIARILATPKSNQRKQFTGSVLLDTNKLVPIEVELSPNIAVQMPFDASLKYFQTFDLVDNFFITPSYLNVYSSVDADFLWVISPRVDIKIETFAYDYEFNKEIPEKYFNRRKVDAAKKADEFDSLFWESNKVIPLAPDEENAYKAIERARENPDSASTEGLLGQYLAPLNRFLAKLARPPFTGWTDMFVYNRVSGVYLGLGIKESITDYDEFYFKGGYGFADKKLYGSLLFKQFIDEEHTFGFTGEVFSNLARSDNPYIVRSDIITLASFFLQNDYGDYYYSDGFKVGIESSSGQLRFIRRDVFERPHFFRLFFVYENQKNAHSNTNFSVFGSGDFRSNPLIIEGIEKSVGFELNYNFSHYRRLSNFGIGLSGLVSHPNIFNSDFNFGKFSFDLNIRTKTLPLWRIDMRLSGGISFGKLPPQRYFSLESAVSGISGNTFKGMEVKEFYGDRYASFAFEHNFGEVIPGVLRIPNVASFGLELILYGNIGYSAFTGNSIFTENEKEFFLMKQTAATDNKYYYELGFGINRILIFLRADFSARFSQRDVPQFYFTIGGSSF